MSDATISNMDGSRKEYQSEKTDKDGILRQRSEAFSWHAPMFNALRVSKPGYLPSDHLVLFRPANGSSSSLPDYAGTVLYAVEDFPDSTRDSPNWKPPPISVTLIKAPATEAERRGVEAEERKRRLPFAVKKGDATTLRALLAEGVGPNTADDRGVPVIAWAAFTGNRDIIFQLLDAGADIRDKKTVAREALLIYLSEGLSFEETRWLLDASRVAQHEEVIRRLVQAGADVNMQSPYRGRALSIAIGRTPPFGQPAYSLTSGIVKYLIARGANVNAAGWEGETPLMSAALKG